MKTLNKALLVAISAVSLSAIAAENETSIPEAIFIPDNAQMTEGADAWIGDGFSYEADVTGTTVAELADQIVNYYTDEGFETVENDIEEDEAEFVFTRGEERIEIDIDLEDEESGLIEYEVDYDK